MENYLKKNTFWGLEVSLDLKRCNASTIRNPKKIEEFIIKICKMIKAKRYGDAQIIHFGKNKGIEGISFTQLIETSLVSGHLANQTNNAYINVFSCKEFDHHKVEDFAREFFQAKAVEKIINYRY